MNITVKEPTASSWTRESGTGQEYVELRKYSAWNKGEDDIEPISAKIGRGSELETQQEFEDKTLRDLFFSAVYSGGGRNQDFNKPASSDLVIFVSLL